jgi:hypothetical protein
MMTCIFIMTNSHGRRVPFTSHFLYTACICYSGDYSIWAIYEYVDGGSEGDALSVNAIVSSFRLMSYLQYQIQSNKHPLSYSNKNSTQFFL